MAMQLQSTNIRKFNCEIKKDREEKTKEVE